MVPLSLKPFLLRLFQVVSIFVVIGIVLPYFLITVPFVVYCSAILGKIILRTSNDAMRLMKLSRSPVVNIFSETIKGLSFIRATNKQDLIRQQHFGCLRQFLRASLVTYGVNIWFTLHLRYISLVVLASVSSYFVISRDVGAAAYALNLEDSIYWLMFMFTALDNRMVSVERAHEFTQVDPEGPFVVANSLISSSWPSRGEIVFTDFDV
eukprot:CAMPEP_0115032816 /NCGR_PEP_ID=MMETSP0216-20121206/39409_1 /TAXON_ID=223996 /ORGANISM="Protocruzia adherens, Strain Boccale" /LENGTH=208 /DNA_ID=CAMNT_0002410839 /DNA_START=571 /DNA_END=1193 /DNA_ORIENTATION=-